MTTLTFSQLPTLTPTDEVLERDVRAWIARGSGIDPVNVIPDPDDNGPVPFADEDPKPPLPDDPFATVHSMEPMIVGIPSSSMPSIRHPFRVTFCRKDSNWRAKVFQAWAYTDEGTTDAEGRDFRIHDMSGIRRMDQIFAEITEEQAQFDLEVSYVQVIDQTIDTFVARETSALQVEDPSDHSLTFKV